MGEWWRRSTKREQTIRMVSSKLSDTWRMTDDYSVSLWKRPTLRNGEWCQRWSRWEKGCPAGRCHRGRCCAEQNSMINRQRTCCEASQHVLCRSIFEFSKTSWVRPSIALLNNWGWLGVARPGERYVIVLVCVLLEDPEKWHKFQCQFHLVWKKLF